MLKNKRILLSILVVLLLFILPTMVNASNETPTINTEVYGANKSIKVTLTDITLDDLNEYKFGISKAKATEPTEWLDLQSIETNECSVIITPENETHINILRSNDKCYLFIKDITNNEIKIITQVDLSLPLDLALNITMDSTKNFNISYLYRNGNDIDSYYITTVKIDDTNIIKKYLEAKENGQDTIRAVQDMLSIQIPNNSWKEMTTPFTYDHAYHWGGTGGNLVKYEGLYMVWGQVNYSEGRSIYGYTLYDNYPNGYKLPEDNEDYNEPSNPVEKTKSFMRENSSANKYIDFPNQLVLESFFDNYEGTATLKNNIKPITIQSQYVYIEHKKIDEWNEKKSQMNEVEFEKFLDEEVEKFVNENAWKDFSDLEVSIKSWDKEIMDAVLFVKIETDTEIVTIYQGYGKGFSALAQEQTNSQENEPGEEQEKSEEDTNKKDTTVAPGTMPYTGGTFVIIISILAIIFIVIYAYKRKNDLKGI